MSTDQAKAAVVVDLAAVVRQYEAEIWREGIRKPELTDEQKGECLRRALADAAPTSPESSRLGEGLSEAEDCVPEIQSAERALRNVLCLRATVCAIDDMGDPKYDAANQRYRTALLNWAALHGHKVLAALEAARLTPQRIAGASGVFRGDCWNPTQAESDKCDAAVAPTLRNLGGPGKPYTDFAGGFRAGWMQRARIADEAAALAVGEKRIDAIGGAGGE